MNIFLHDKIKKVHASSSLNECIYEFFGGKVNLTKAYTKNHFMMVHFDVIFYPHHPLYFKVKDGGSSNSILDLQVLLKNDNYRTLVDRMSKKFVHHIVFYESVRAIKCKS